MLFDRSKKIVTLFNETNRSIATLSYNDSLFVKTVCMRKVNSAFFLDSIKCPHKRFKVFTEFWETSHPFLLTFEKISKVFPDSGVKNESGTDLRDYFLVHVESLSQKVLVKNKEQIYPMSKLVSDIGGMLGLWLGASMVGLIHLMKNCQQMCVRPSRVSGVTDNPEETTKDFEEEHKKQTNS